MQYVDLGVNPYKYKKNSKRKKYIKFGVSALLLGLILYGGYLFYWPISQLIGEIINRPGIVLSFIKNPSGKIESTDGRTNVLLLGIDKSADVPFSYKDSQGITHKNGFLADTIIVLSVGKEKDMVMVSIPRDTWVDIPSWENVSASSGKINSVYSVGNIQEYPGGGLELSKKVVSDIIGVPIHYAARIDFKVFKQIVDTLGGVEVRVDKTFDDYKYPIDGKEEVNCSSGDFFCRYTNVHFDEGIQTMDGTKALQFVRSRTGTNGEGSDFARAERQQKVLVAIRRKALTFDILLDPIKVNNLFDDFGESIETDFDLTSYLAAYQLLKDIDVSNTKKLVLDTSKNSLLYNPNPADYGGAYVLLPKDGWGEIQKRVDNLLFPKLEK